MQSNFTIFMIKNSLPLLLAGAAGILSAQNLPSTRAKQSGPRANQQLSNAESVPVAFLSNADIATLSIPAQPVEWGMDVAWDSEDNVRRGTNYIGKENLAVGRVSFQPSDLIGSDGELSAAQKSALQTRLDHIAVSGVKQIILNCDHEVLCNEESYPNWKQNYNNYYGKPQEWLKVIRASVKYCRSKGFEVVTISPFNEPDYTPWNEGTKAHFKEIAKLISEDEYLAGIRISAGNTLNCDKALEWYNAVKPYVTEGNTHQLAGSFDNYASFWETVRGNGHHATADEVHNVGEAFIGVHYGLQTGVWWGWDGAARGEYCKAAAHGKEIGYAENRDAWTAAAVYKRTDGRIDGFLGTSERQATPSSYEFISTDVPAYFDGVGPYYNYIVDMPGGTGYQVGQTNAERMVLIHHGEDVPVDPVLAGNYVIMNAKSTKCLGTKENKTDHGTAMALRSYSSSTPQTYYQWTVEPIPATSHGDLGYFFLRWVKNTSLLADVKDWNTSSGAEVIAVAGGKGTNEQWFLEYAGNDFWYIRSRHNGLYVGVKDDATTMNSVLRMDTLRYSESQKWRFIPVEASPKLEQVAPEAPASLKAVATSATIELTWEASVSEDVVGYNVIRDGETIARLVEGTSFLDNDVRPGMQHQYAVKAVDATRNQSVAATAEATLSANQALLLHYTFENDSLDQTGNQLHPLIEGKANYTGVRKKEGEKSLLLNNTSRYMQLPAMVGYHDEMTLAMWVYVSKTTAWQRIFDFGNGTDQYFFLTPNNGSEMRLVLKNKGDEQILEGNKLTTGWHYIAVTLSADKVCLYADENCYESSDITLRPSQFLPKRNFIGMSQFKADPVMTGYIDDLRLYNFPLSAQQVAGLMEGVEPELEPGVSAIENVRAIENAPTAEAQSIYTLDGRQLPSTVQSRGFYIYNGRKYLVK